MLVDQTKYRSMIGGLMYLTASRPDIAFATFVCARYQARPTEKHLKDVKRIFRYLRQSINMGLCTSEGIQFLGDKLASWSSKKQDCIAMSSAEAEYVSLSACCTQVIWMRTQLLDYGFHYYKIPIYYHVEKGAIELYFVETEYQLADLFTKAHPNERFEFLVHKIGMRCMTPTQLERLAKLSSRMKDHTSKTFNYLKEQTLYELKVKIYSENNPTSGIRACVETLNKKNSIVRWQKKTLPPPTITAMKIPIIRKGEYDIWSMRMRQYICHTDHNLWDVIVNGDLEEEPAPTGETYAPPAPKTAKQLAAKRNQERVKSILVL
ncbi:hypothetical protein Tco_1106278, partial [Tanacetum coccineum]